MNTSCTTCSLNGKLVPRSWARVVLATAQPLVESADQLFVRNEHLLHEHLAELRFTGDLHERADFHTGCGHVDDQIGEPFVLGRVLIGAGQADPPAGELRIGRPYLLSGEEPAPFHCCGARRERCKIAAGIGL